MASTSAALIKAKLERSSMATALRGAKLERPVKAELQSAGALRAKVERSGGFQAVIKAESSVKAELRRKKEEKEEEEAKHTVKLERTKLEAKNTSVKAELQSQVAALLQRGMDLRAQAASNAKREVKSELKRCVKSELGTRKTATRKRKGAKGRRKASAARRNASREVINRKVPLSRDLADLLGAPALSRPEAVKRLWARCKEDGMQNPDDRREIRFDERMSELFGRPTARITDLLGLLMPHFDYASQAKAEPATAAVKTKQSPKEEAAAARSVKRQMCKGEFTKSEIPARMKAEAASAAKREVNMCGAAKREQAGINLAVKAEVAATRTPECQIDLEELVRALVPRITAIEREAVVVECEPSEVSGYRLELVALPAGSGAGVQGSPGIVRAACSVDFREVEDGSLRPRAEARLAGLAPGLAYGVAFQAWPSDAAVAAPLCVDEPEERRAPRSPEVMLPQRASPERWTPQEALLWFAALQVPELVRKAREYAIDGATLLALGDEDLQALGLAAPFLRRRVLAGIQALRGGGAKESSDAKTAL